MMDAECTKVQIFSCALPKIHPDPFLCKWDGPCVYMYIMRRMRRGPNLHDHFRMNHTSSLDSDAVDHVKGLFPAFSVFSFVCLFCLKSNSHCRHVSW